MAPVVFKYERKIIFSSLEMSSAANNIDTLPKHSASTRRSHAISDVARLGPPGAWSFSSFAKKATRWEHLDFEYLKCWKRGLDIFEHILKMRLNLEYPDNNP